MKKNWVVYMHTNIINDKKYIGITHQKPERRWRNGNGYHNGCFEKAILKYGWDNFIHTILEKNLTFDEAKIKEQFYIKFYNTKPPNGYNLTDGGEGTLNWKPSEEFKKQISKIQKAIWTDEYKKQTSKKRKSPDSVYQSSEFKQKISSIVSGVNNPNYGNKWTDEQTENLRQKQKRNPIYKNENNPNAKRIMCIETSEIFNCIKYAKEKYNIKSDGSLTVALKNQNRTAAGLHWKYL